MPQSAKQATRPIKVVYSTDFVEMM